MHSQIVTLKVYDMLGNEVTTLVNEEKQPGIYEVEFSAKGGSASGGDGCNFPSGIYFYQLKAGNFMDKRNGFVEIKILRLSRSHRDREIYPEKNCDTVTTVSSKNTK